MKITKKNYLFILLSLIFLFLRIADHTYFIRSSGGEKSQVTGVRVIDEIK